MTEVEAFQKIKSIFKNVPDLRLRIAVESLQLTHLLKRDLGFDSLAIISLFMELQEIRPDLREEDAAQWQTLHDCVRSLAAG